MDDDFVKIEIISSKEIKPFKQVVQNTNVEQKVDLKEIESKSKKDITKEVDTNPSDRTDGPIEILNPKNINFNTEEYLPKDDYIEDYSKYDINHILFSRSKIQNL